jgi:hypothetical protein
LENYEKYLGGDDLFEMLNIVKDMAILFGIDDL